MDVLGGRKFIFAIVLVLACFGLVLAGKATVDQWVNFSELMGGIYVAGNVGEKLTDVMKKQ